MIDSTYLEEANCRGSGKSKNLIIGGLLGTIFLIMGTEIFFLARENRSLRVQIEKLSRRQAETIPIGWAAPDFALKPPRTGSSPLAQLFK